MNKEELIAPEQYNIVMEVEKYKGEKDKQALVWMDDKGQKEFITYDRLIQDMNKVGNALLENGCVQGDKIIVMMPRLLATYKTYLAALKTGIIIVPASEMLRTKDLQYRITHGEVKGVVSYYAYADEFRGVKEYDQLLKFSVGAKVEGWYHLDDLAETSSNQLEMAPTRKDDMAFLPYTSGTTGNPKGVVHTHGWGFAHLKTAAPNWLGIQEDDKVWATAGPGWQKWIWSPLLSVLGSGATGFVYNGRFEAKTYLQLLQDEHINVLCCTPTEYRFMVKVDNLGDYQLPDLHSAVSAGEPLNVEVIDTFQRHFAVTVRDGYGQTENTLLLGVTKDMTVKPGSMGKPTPGNEVAIIDEKGVPLPAGQMGDIALKQGSPALFREYYKDPERTQQTRRGDYYVTGDQASMDEDGYFWFEGRRDDIIISSGYTIGPFEVEDVLVKHPSVQECAVVAKPNENRGSIVKAFVVLKTGSIATDDLAKALQNHVKQLTAPYKYPREIEFVEELPKTISQKIRHVELREQEQDH